jgi:hypothetical protein
MNRFDGSPLQFAEQIDTSLGHTIIPIAPDVTGLIEGLNAAAILASAGLPFVLHFPIELSYQAFGCKDPVMDQVRLMWRTHCQLPMWKPSLMAFDIASSIVSAFPQFGALHIRRGDVKTLCDSTPINIGLLAGCLYGKFNGDFPAIIVCTDEHDKNYLREVTTQLKKFARSVIHVDSVARELLLARGIPNVDVDNYILFEICKAAEKKALIRTQFGGHGSHQKEECDRATRCAYNNNLV